MGLNTLGKTSAGFDLKLNLLYIFSLDKQSPTYYRILPGNIKDVTSLKLSLEEIGLTKILVVADKGFVSKANLELLQELQAQFLMPLKRDHAWIQYEKLQLNDPSQLDSYFMYQKKPIWHYSYERSEEKLKIFVFLNDQLRCEERSDYLIRLEQDYKGYSKEDFFNKQIRFGTLSIAISTSSDLSAQQVYLGYK